MRLVERMQAEAINIVNAYIDRIMRELATRLTARYKADAIGDIGSIAEGRMSHTFLERMFRLTDAQAAADLRAVAPVATSDVLQNARILEQKWVERNTDLIKLEQRAQQEVRNVLADHPVGTARVEDVRAALEERLGVVRSRAELIARDQTLKLYGQIQGERQTAAGIVEYTWSTSDDERVREDHAALDGTTQRWDTPPIVDKRTGRREHPGGDFQCRCSAVPRLDTAEDAPVELVAGDTPPGATVARDVPAELTREVAPPPPPPDRRQEQEAARQRAREQIRAEREARLAKQERAAVVKRELANRVPEAPGAAYVVRAGGQNTANVEHIERLVSRLKPGRTPILEAIQFVERDAIRGGGEYDPRTQTLTVLKTGRPPGAEFAEGRILLQGAAGVERESVADLANDVQASVVMHEYGHHIHLTGGPEVDRLINDVYRQEAPNAAAKAAQSGVTLHIDLRELPPEGSVSRYGATNHEEFWAEAFASYNQERDWLRVYRPRVFKLVQDVLALLGGPPR